MTCVIYAEPRTSSGSTPYDLSINQSIRPSIGNTFECVPMLCILQLNIFSFLYFETLDNDCLHIQDVRLLFCVHFINIFFISGVGELGHFYVKTTYIASWLCSM